MLPWCLERQLLAGLQLVVGWPTRADALLSSHHDVVSVMLHNSKSCREPIAYGSEYLKYAATRHMRASCKHIASSKLKRMTSTASMRTSLQYSEQDSIIYQLYRSGSHLELNLIRVISKFLT